MTRTYSYTFKTIRKNEANEFEWVEKTLTKKVTDRMEPRGDAHKRAYASAYFNQILREQYGRKRAEAFGYNIKEV